MDVKTTVGEIASNMSDSPTQVDGSTEDSDNDLLNPLESPSDSYFGSRNQPQETFAENSSAQADSDAKRREAAQSQASNDTGALPGPAQYERAAPSGSLLTADEFTPLLDAPPDYAAAVASRPPTHTHYPPTDAHPIGQQWERQGMETNRRSESGAVESYEPTGHSSNRANDASSPSRVVRISSSWHGTFTRNGLATEHQVNGGVWAQATPHQSMRDGFNASSHSGPDADGAMIRHSRERKIRRKCMDLRRYFACANLVNVILVIVVIALIMLLAKGASTRFHDAPMKDGNHEKPVTSHCAYAAYSNALEFEFHNPTNFSFVNSMEHANYFSRRVLGAIKIRGAPREQQVPITVAVAYATTEPWVAASIDFAHTNDSLELRLREDRKGYTSDPCIDFDVTISVRSDVQVRDWELVAASLDIIGTSWIPLKQDESAFDVPSGLRRPDSISITTVSGDVLLESWFPREMIVKTESGSISGTYGLYDLLALRSRSGSIDVKVSPKQADPAEPSPAQFIAITESGSMHVGFDIDWIIPKRDYQTRVATTSGQITGRYILGSSLSLRSTSGSIRADVLPFTTDGPSSLASETMSSSTSLSVMSPYQGNSTAMDQLHSTHQSISGRLSLVYPQAWEGAIEGRTTSGSLDVKGKDVVCYWRGDLPPLGNRFVGRKGYGRSKIDFQTVSGSVILQVGD